MKKLIFLFSLALILSALTLFAPSAVSAQYGCSYHLYQACSGSNLYWYDSCGSQQDVAQYCSNGCYNGYCQNYNNDYNNNYNNYGNCTYHAYKLCLGNSIYWYDSCGTQQDLVQYCSNGQICQYGQCAAYVQPITPIQPYNNYVAHYKTACSGNSIYWYDSLGTASGLYKNCGADSTCIINSCTAIVPTPAPVQSPAPTPVPAITASGLSVSFFAKQDLSSTQWQKSAQIGSNGQIFFMISLANTSTNQIDNVNISANIPNKISSLGNLQINGVPVAGDIVTGINIGSISPSTTKSITFEGKTQTISAASTEQGVATSNARTDSVSIDFAPGLVAAVSSAPATSGFAEFFKRWYIWILAGLVLIILFIIVFKRLSSNV